MLRYTWFVCISLLLSGTWFSGATAQHQHQHEGIVSRMSKGLIRGRVEEMRASANMNGWCRRCLRIEVDEVSFPPEAAPTLPEPVAPPPAAAAAAAAVDLPTLPTDDDPTDDPPSPRTNPSSLLTPSGASVPGATTVTHPSGVAGKVGFSAGVGLTASVGLGVLLLGGLYYFKPDLFFLCCKTCVRVQVFHHSAAAAAAANSKK